MVRRKPLRMIPGGQMAGPQPRLIVPPRHAGSVKEQLDEAKANKPRLLRAVCPKCSLEFHAPEQYGVSFCECGWLLRLEPIAAGRVGGRYEPILHTDAVMEVVPAGYKLEDALCQERAKAAIQKVIENWRQRGLARLEIDQASGRFGIRMPTHAARYDAEAERKHREQLGPMKGPGPGHVDVRELERKRRDKDGGKT